MQVYKGDLEITRDLHATIEPKKNEISKNNEIRMRKGKTIRYLEKSEIHIRNDETIRDSRATKITNIIKNEKF